MQMDANKNEAKHGGTILVIPTGRSRDRWISPSSRPACSTQNILRQPGMHSESLSLKQRNKRKEKRKTSAPFQDFY